jgi:CubicO group peptidase (beta-lactamase class C family)
MPAAFLLAFLVLATATAARGDDTLGPFVRQALETARARHHVPGIAAYVQVGAATAAAAVGVRADGHPEAVTVDDLWHIGSDTKAFTATLMARLAERHVLSLDDTLAACFPALANEMDPAYRRVTIAQLLSHTAGLPPQMGLLVNLQLRAMVAVGTDLRAQRTAIARKYLTMSPASKAGAFAYSNVGYIIAGAIAEARTGKPWEKLVREEVFAPLGITHAGFGPPGTSAHIDQPRGHRSRLGWLSALDPAAADADNPPALGPAGTINISLADWARFARDQMDGAHGHGKLLSPASYRRLQTPVAENYALGWVAKLDAAGTPGLLQHTGSNTYWLADIRILPGDDTIELVVMNAADKEAQRALEEIRAALRTRLKTGR